MERYKPDAYVLVPRHVGHLTPGLLDLGSVPLSESEIMGGVRQRKKGRVIARKVKGCQKWIIPE